MPRIRLMLEDGQGNPLGDDATQIYPLTGDRDTINQIEMAVEKLKNAALPDLEQALLSKAQQRFVGDVEKGEPRS